VVLVHGLGGSGKSRLLNHFRDMAQGRIPGSPVPAGMVATVWLDWEDERLHDLRHFFASGLIAAGCDVVTVRRALGHRSATVTLATYAHLWPTAEDRTRQAAAAMLGEVLGLADCVRTTGTGDRDDLR
jgi:integrase